MSLLLVMGGLRACGADTAALVSGAPAEKAAAAQALGYARDASAVGALAKAAQDVDPAVACAAAEALGEIGTEAAADALLKAWAGGSPAVLGNALLRCAEARREAKDAAVARKLYEACGAEGTEPQKAAARAGLAALGAASGAMEPAPLLERLRDESLWVRLPAVREAVGRAEASALPALFELALRAEEDGRAATLALAAIAAGGADEFLYGEMKKGGAGRCKAIDVLAARGQPELARRLCDAPLYDAAGVSAAAGSAWRACLRQEDFAAALAFAFGPSLPAGARDPLVAALGAVAQQLPDQARVMREIGGQLEKAEPASKAELLGLLAGLEGEGARELLAGQMKAGDAEARKAVVRTFSKWSSALAVQPLLSTAKEDPDRGVRILAARSLLALMRKPGAVDKQGQLAALAELAAAAERDEEKRAVYDFAKAVGGHEADALRAKLAASLGLAGRQERRMAAVNAGGGAVGAFQADTGFSGGSAYAVKREADLSDACDAAPEEVYQSCRFRDVTYTFDGLAAGSRYTLRLHFAETFHQKAGARVFDVSANGRALLTDYDIYAKTGARMKAVTESFEVAADAAGKLVVAFKTKRDQALVNGLEVLEIAVSGQQSTAGGQGVEIKTAAVVAAAPRPAGMPGRLNVLLLSGANNHNWRETTPAVQAILEGSKKFAVTVIERSWDMKPADVDGCDLVFNNWNTFGKDKREWTAEMKSAFLAWFKSGGGFFVLHAGGSLFYDWEAFQTLTGGAWEKGTFHPHMQRFAVSIADPAHPVTRGMTDFEIFDEPWQRTGNRNPGRHVLLTGVISKENKGSGEPEPFAWTTQLGRGRCFNLVLGHDVGAITNAACQTLVLRGAEWAATGDVK